MTNGKNVCRTKEVTVLYIYLIKLVALGCSIYQFICILKATTQAEAT